MQQITNWLITNGIGDWASVIGILIAIPGFIIMIYTVWRSKSITENIEETIRKIHADFNRTESIFDCSSALSLIKQIKFLQRNKHWDTLPEKYSELRNYLVAIRKIDFELSDKQKSAIQGAMVELRKIENEIETMISSNENTLNISRANMFLSKQMEVLQDIFMDIKNRIGR